jgi:hypothetical protein
MTTLTQPTVSKIIDRLFAETDAAEARRDADFSLAGRAADRNDYLNYYAQLKDQPLPVSRATGKLLYMLARSIRAKTIIEFGTSFGISTLHLAAAAASSAANSSRRRYCERAQTWLPPICPIWWKFVRATHSKRSPAIFPTRSILYCSTERRISTHLSSRCLRAGCVSALLLLLTTRIRAQNISLVSDPPRAAIYRFRSPTTWNCRCDWQSQSPATVPGQPSASGLPSFMKKGSPAAT